MRKIGMLAAAVALVLCGCEAAGPADVAGVVAPARLEAVPAQALPGELAAPAIVDLVAVPPAVVVPVDPGTQPTVGLQYDGSIAFRRGTK
jgi:hypothetical protein